MIAVAGGILLAILVLVFWRVIVIVALWAVMATLAITAYFAIIHPLLV